MSRRNFPIIYVGVLGLIMIKKTLLDPIHFKTKFDLRRMVQHVNGK